MKNFLEGLKTKKRIHNEVRFYNLEIGILKGIKSENKIKIKRERVNLVNKPNVTTKIKLNVDREKKHWYKERSI